jgi:tetratricopeptide (TPR) repeat protein
MLILTTAIHAAPQSDSRSGAWDRSVAFEIQGNLAAAENVMHQSWGTDPHNYWVLLRLAYLALLQQRFEEACGRYQTLRTMPESAGDPDGIRGHASALAALGWQRVKSGETAKARSLFHKAITLDAANRSAISGLKSIPPLPLVIPELWSGIATHSLGRNRYQGLATYAQLPIRIAEEFVLRGAFRYVHSKSTTPGSPYRFSEPSRSAWHLDEEFVTLAHETLYVGTELIGIRSKITDRQPIWGGAGRLRMGALWGLIMEAAVLKANGLATNTQLRPMAFYNFFHRLVLQAGLRITRDQQSNLTSANAGVSTFLGDWSLHLQGHLGKERWAFGTVGPSLMSLDVDTKYGGSATLIGPITKDLHFAVQAEGERLQIEGAVGAYFSLSAGIQLALGEL